MVTSKTAVVIGFIYYTIRNTKNIYRKHKYDSLKINITVKHFYKQKTNACVPMYSEKIMKNKSCS